MRFRLTCRRAIRPTKMPNLTVSAGEMKSNSRGTRARQGNKGRIEIA
jgi:hypothetical protein